MSKVKEKRTKEAVLKLLDNAMAQEEVLVKKVAQLESELADCRSRVKNPRHEVDELALSNSKISFRLDYYQTENKGPFKCIIEHLPSRESQTFEGKDSGSIGAFVSKFVQAVSQTGKTKRAPGSKKPLDAPPALTTSPLKAKAPQAEPAATRLFNAPFSVLTDTTGGDRRAIQKGQAFQIQIPMQALEPFQGKPCRVSISAVSLEKRPRQTLNTSALCLPDRDKAQLPVQNFPLDLGVYLLKVAMTLQDAPKMARYEESRLLIVQ